MKKEIWLIRHGESEANAGLESSNPATIPLTKKGHKQAEKVCKIIPEAPSKIIVSPYTRAKQTAQLAIERFSSAEVVEWPIQEFTYLSSAACKNTTSAQRRPMTKKYWETNDPFYVHGEGAESFADLLNRTQDAFERIKEIERGFVLVFGHGQFMRTLLLSLLLDTFDPTPALMYKLSLYNKVFKIPNCGILKMKFDNQQPFVSGLITHHLDD